MKRPGDILKKRRQELGLTLQELESNSNIPRRNLEALEGDQYEFFAAESYYYGFLKNYAESLKLDPGILLNAYQNVKIIESPLPMEQLTGNTRNRKLPPLVIGSILLLFAIGGLGYFIYYKAKEPGPQESDSGSAENRENNVGTADSSPSAENVRQKISEGPGTVRKYPGPIIVNRYPWMQDLEDGLILHFVLDPERNDLRKPKLRVVHTAQGFQLVSLNLDRDYELTLAGGKTNSLSLYSADLILPSQSDTKTPDTDTNSYRLDFAFQRDEGPAVLINLSRNDRTATETQTVLPDSFPQDELRAKFEAFRQQYRDAVPHAILQVGKPVTLQLRLTFQQDSYIRYQWFGQKAREFPVLQNKQLLLQGEAPLTLWLSDVDATKIKINGQDLMPEAFQNVFIGRLEWKREASVARLYLTPGP
ncbi:helix-turn-helix domain-containing protein [Candidatus Haliotispira prima]|uniref:Helix-turn-helix domain-containing protein n=1 Tax=Candidatus Haliotispira prima TaxID=3034016 RepID=A0ABY8MHH2_9SPIO|nr:helix-turn-helix domain-containing protein [Candidatus Haliotispira prima]